MNRIEAENKALDFAIERGYDGIAFVGERDGQLYFFLFAESNNGRKTGLPSFIKVATRDGSITLSKGWEEAMWAMDEMRELYGS